MTKEVNSKLNNAPKIVVASTVALSFISFWRGGAIVLSDLASTMFYIGGIAEQAVGPSAPWLVLCVMFFTFAVRSVYFEGCSMFVRGGVYAVVRNSMGRFAARLTVSALIFDYLLTGPISSVSAGHYIGHLLNQFLEKFGLNYHIPPAEFSVMFAVCVTIFFWRLNIHGIHESSTKALRIIQLTTIMVVTILIWSVITIVTKGLYTLPPLPTPDNLRFSSSSLGWLDGTIFPQIGAIAVVLALGHSFLAMSGFETLAQVYRELAYPKLVNLRRTGNLVCWYAVCSTGLITLFAGIIIPPDIRAQYTDNLIGGLSDNLAGPALLRLIFHTFVVIVGALILSGAVNTAIIGANSVLNRIAEDGVIFDWFRKPHPKYGTTYRIIHCFVVLQIFTIFLSKGDVYLLGEAYAFGVVWSFFLKSIGVFALRYQRSDQEYKVPFNFRIGRVEIPLGLIITTLVLFFIAIANLFTKQHATQYGILFTLVLFVLFSISQFVNARKKKSFSAALEEFNLEKQELITPETIGSRAGGMLVAVRDYNQMHHLKWALDRVHPGGRDITVVTVRITSAGEGEYELTDEQYFAEYERELFTRVVQMAEKEGKTVSLLVAAGANPFEVLVNAAAAVKAHSLVTGVSPRMTAEELSRQIGIAWEMLQEPRHPFSLVAISPNEKPQQFTLGPHTPRLWPEDVQRVHSLWLALSDLPELGSKIHHRDVIGFALRQLERNLNSDVEREEIIKKVRAMIKSGDDLGSTDR